MADYEANQRPAGGHVHRLPAPLNRFVNLGCCFLGRDDPECFGGIFQQNGIDKAWLDGDDIDAVARQPVAQRFQVGGQPRFTGVVDR